MILERVEIDNLFSYYGSHPVDLAPTEDKSRNILLIRGRNGFGKTSFLNILKLAFGGISRELLRGAQLAVGQEKTYVMGGTERWLGLMNLKASREGRSLCEVRVFATEGAHRYEIRRTWEILKTSYREHLELRENGKALEAEEAKAVLHELLPPYALPYFFFDGELIQSIAESQGEDLYEPVEKMLDIYPLRTLRSALEERLKDWRRSSIQDQSVRSELAQLDGEIKALEIRQAELKEQVSQLQHEQEQLRIGREVRRREMDDQRARGYAQGRQKKLGERDTLIAELAQRKRDFVLRRLPLAPLWLNPGLARQAIAALELDSRESEGQGEQGLFVRRLMELLPVQVLDMPPHPTPLLNEQQRDVLRHKIIDCLKPYAPARAETPGGRVPVADAARIRAQVAPYAGLYKEWQAVDAELSVLAEKEESLRQVLAQLDDLQDLGESERERFEALRDRDEEEGRHAGALEEQVRQLQVQHKAESRTATRKRERLEILEARLTAGANAQGRIRLSEQVLALLDQLISQARQRRHREIEEAVNMRFRRLFTSHGLVGRVELTQQFELLCRDRQDREIGRMSLSAGMRQLLAFTFMWALKDAGHRELPVVIDSPLARLDRSHQEDVLKYYLPRVGRQVIVLPTDSEIGPDRLKHIEAHVYRRYELTNADGMSSALISVEI